MDTLYVCPYKKREIKGKIYIRIGRKWCINGSTRGQMSGNRVQSDLSDLGPQSTLLKPGGPQYTPPEDTGASRMPTSSSSRWPFIPCSCAARRRRRSYVGTTGYQRVEKKKILTATKHVYLLLFWGCLSKCSHDRYDHKPCSVPSYAPRRSRYWRPPGSCTTPCCVFYNTVWRVLFKMCDTITYICTSAFFIFKSW